MVIETIKVRVKKLNPDAKIPTHGSFHAAGFDIYSCEDYELQPGEVHMFSTGLAYEIPEGKVFFLWDRSGMGAKGIHRFSGVIDSDYRGEVKVVLFNARKDAFKISKGDRLCQGLIQDYYKPEFIEADELSDSSRGAGGFGSTGK